MGVVSTLLVVLLSALTTHESSNSPTIPFNPGDYRNTIYVDPSNPNSTDTPSCYKADNKQYPCADINFALAFPGRQVSTAFLLNPDTTHYLDNTNYTVFAESNHVAFIGDHGTAVVKCREGAGLAFLYCTNVTFIGVRFLYCGAWRDSTSIDFAAKKSLEELKFVPIRVGLYFYNCRDVTMTHMSVSNSTEAVGVVMYSTAGVNYIGYSQFENNRISENNKNDSGGGGFAVEFNYCKPGDTNCSESNHQTENNKNAVYTFKHCSFSYNHGIDQTGKNGTKFSILPRNQTHSSLGRGGGLSLYFKGKALNNSISIFDCNFSRNHATWGAGMAIELIDSSLQNAVQVLLSRFSDNYCYLNDSSKGGPGGGVRVATFTYLPYPVEDLKRNWIVFKWCQFKSNKALFGGGLSISFHRQPNSIGHQLPQVNISGSIFSLNSARLGSAVSVDRDHYFTRGKLGRVYIRACVFEGNLIVYVNHSEAYSVGIGTLYISEVEVEFKGFLNFISNNGTALAVVGTVVYFADNFTGTFKDNTGLKGGAISLLGTASLVISKYTSLTFTNNVANLYGGAIFNNYIGKEDLRSSIKCFLQYDRPFIHPSQWQTRFKFTGNRAEKLGNSIYSTTILPCVWSEGALSSSSSISDVFCWNSSNWIYTNSTCDREIYTQPRAFDLSHVKRTVYPGHNFHLHITATDDLEHDVTADTIYTGDISSNNSVAQVDPRFSYIADGYTSITGKEDQKLTLKLNTDGSRDWVIHVDIVMDRCPPGYVAKAPQASFITTNSSVYNDSLIECDCIISNTVYSFRGNLLCDKTNLVSKIRNGFWIGYIPAINGSKLYMGTTMLLHKYNDEDFFPLARHYERLDFNQCSYLNRTGPLCGQCIPGHSAAVNSFGYDCVQCLSNSTNFAHNVLTYLGLTYLPYLAFFVVIIYFDIRLMSGPLVGFILYAQLIGSGVVDLTINSIPYIKGNNALQVIQKTYRVTYGVFNLDSFSVLMEPFCICENFSALDVICLDYAVALFPLLLIVITYVLIRLKDSIASSRREGIRNIRRARARENIDRIPERSIIHSLVNFMYLTYTKFAFTSIKLMSTTTIFDENGKYPNLYLVYYAGQYYFGQKDYILPYGLIAILMFIVFAIFLPLFFLLGPINAINWLNDQPRCHCLNKRWPTLTINHYMDAFQGCYKPNRQYFTGLYLIFRIVFFIIFAFSDDEVGNRGWQIIFLFVIAMLVAFLQPYRVPLLQCAGCS